MSKLPAKIHQEKLGRIKKNIDEGHAYFKENVARYHNFKKWVFKSCLRNTDVDMLRELGWPEMEFNELEAYISRLRGEFSKQAPSISVRSIEGEVNPRMVEVIENHMRSIMIDANNDQFENEVYKDTLSGGFSVVKVWTEYVNDHSFNQEIRVGTVFDPTMCGFDPLARLPHKGDGKYCYELYPKLKEEVEREYGIKIEDMNYRKTSSEGVNWFYENKNEKVVLLADYYEKEPVEKTIVRIATNEVMTLEDYQKLLEQYEEMAEVAPAEIERRKTHSHRIVRYKLLGDRVLAHEVIKFKDFPLTFVDGNSAYIRDSEENQTKQMTRPYVYHAIDAQRLKNYAAQAFTNGMASYHTSKFMIPQEGIPENDDGWTQPQRQTILTYNHVDKDGNPIPGPAPVTQAPVPQEYSQAFTQMDSAIQNILGSYDAALGINNNQLSGVAIVEGATQSNASAMPFVMNFMASLNQVAQIVLDLIPKYYTTPRTIPLVSSEGERAYVYLDQNMINGMRKEHHNLGVRVKSSVNFQVQQARAIDQIKSLAQSIPSFGAMINQAGLPVILDNLDIRGIDELKQIAAQFIEQQQMAQQQPNPAAMQAQMEMQMQQKDMQLKERELQLKEQKLRDEQMMAAQEAQNEALKLENERMKIILNSAQDVQSNHVQMTKAQAERESDLTKLVMADMHHKQNIAHDILKERKNEEGTT